MLVTEPMERLKEIVDAAVAGGVNGVQLRDRSASAADLLETAERLKKTIAGRALLVVNGSIEAVARARAEGVHLPEATRSVAEARRILGDDAIVGRSIHSVDEACVAEREGADYVVAGTIFASRSHPDEAPAGIDFLRAVCESVSIPVIAIGGVTPENAGDCIAAGAAGVAVLSPIMLAADPCRVARKYARALTSFSTPEAGS